MVKTSAAHLKQRFIVAYFEFFTPQSAREIEKILRSGAMPAFTRLWVGIDHKNLMNIEHQSNGPTSISSAPKTLAEMQLSGESTMIDFECVCGNTWTVKGYKDREGIYAMPNAEQCNSCGNIGKQKELS